MKKLIFLFLVFLSGFFVKESNAQFFECALPDTTSETIGDNPFPGLYKPLRTDIDGNGQTSEEAYFPVLVIFVQFKDEGGNARWPQNQPPVYIDSMIATNKVEIEDWWDAYNEATQPISDYWQELSRGTLHVVGAAYSIVLDSNASYYAGLSDSQRDNVMNHEIWTKLKHPSLGINWQDYDLWKKDGGEFYYEPDGYIDFIYKIHKSISGGLPPFGGFASLSWWGCNNYIIDSANNITINHSYSSLGSGLTVVGTDRLGLLQVIGHEHAHFTYAPGHITYGRASYGVGFDAYFSPYEMIACEYMEPTEITFGNLYDLDDYSSRNEGDGEILKVPIQGNEFFLIANRRKISNWDRLMLGDTALYDAFNNTEYGKGVYIYHVKNGIIRPGGDIPPPQDLECADGYWNWEFVNYGEVDLGCWTGGGFHHFERTTPRYDNDATPLHTYNLTGDGLSLHYFVGYHPITGRPVGMANLFGRGKRGVTNCVVGTDRIFTNDSVLYSNFENQGDRYDAWNVGYNEVFSPYSSPSTAKWNNDTSGIFIWYKELHHDNLAAIEIYRAGYNGYSEEDILELTPPSRPMGLKVQDDFTSAKIKLTWNHNMEPDMNSISDPSTKQYKIYKAEGANMTVVPTNYQFLASVSFTDQEEPSYIDTTVNALCCLPDPPCPGGGCIQFYPVRYYVTAVDNTDWESVPSDFVRTQGWKTVLGGGGKEEDNISLNPDKEFKFDQNFPNPFNPVTNIQFNLPYDVFVSIKIYDISGREILTLVNEFRKAGNYITSFDASKLSSGAYFYKIKAGSFESVRKMILLK